MAFFKKRAWNNEEYKKKCQLLDKWSLASMVLIFLSIWLLPNMVSEASSRYVALLFVLISVVLIFISWSYEQKDKKYIPPTDDESIDIKSE